MRTARIATAGLAAAAMSTALVCTAGAASATTAHREPSCTVAVRAVREVAGQAHIRIGSAHTGGGVLVTTPRTWARELRSAGLVQLAQAAAAAYGAAGNHQFVIALDATGLAIAQGGNGTCTR